MPDRAHTIHDVRMRGFPNRATVAEAHAWLDARIQQLDEEMVSLTDAAGRVLFRDVTSDVDVPQFDRAMMDGYALRADDAAGATPYHPLELTIVGEALPGAPFLRSVAAGQAVRIMTGAPMPAGANAVLPAERTETAGDTLRALADVSPGKHVGLRGEDVRRGTVVLHAGRRLRPQDIGLLSSIGVGRAPVVRRARVRIVITGNELLPTGSAPTETRIVDANGPMLAALVARDGGIPFSPGIIPDQPDEILHAMRDEADVVLVSGGSSVGQEDHAPVLLGRHGDLGVHGVAMRPSSPAGMGVLDGHLVFLLPGNPVSCLCAYDFFAGSAIRRMGGRPGAWPYFKVRATLERKISSVVGRVDYARVAWANHQPEGTASAGAASGSPLVVTPLSIGGASVLSSTTNACGFVVVPADSEGRPEGAEVDVYLYDAIDAGLPDV